MNAKYDTIGVDYNRTRKADPYLAQQLLQHLQPSPEGVYLDIGCGTGNYTSALQQKGVDFIGIDPSERMLEQARRKNANINWRKGTAERTGLPAQAADGLIGSLTMHHWSDLSTAFAELHRILKPNARVVLFTSTPEQMRGYWLNHYFPKMLSDSMRQMPTLDQVITAMTNAGIDYLETHPYFIQPDLEDQFLYCGKHDPTLYLKAQIRQGISSFSDLSNQTEVEQGLAALKTDIDSGAINKVIQSYANNGGDYLYIIGRKPE